MFPWLIFGVIAVPLLLVGFLATRRKTDAGEPPASGETLTDKELGEAEDAVDDDAVPASEEDVLS